jgi:hypothetical protein
VKFVGLALNVATQNDGNLQNVDVILLYACVYVYIRHS